MGVREVSRCISTLTLTVSLHVVRQGGSVHSRATPVHPRVCCRFWMAKCVLPCVNSENCCHVFCQPQGYSGSNISWSLTVSELDVTELEQVEKICLFARLTGGDYSVSGH